MNDQRRGSGSEDVTRRRDAADEEATRRLQPPPGWEQVLAQAGVDPAETLGARTATLLPQELLSAVPGGAVEPSPESTLLPPPLPGTGAITRGTVSMAVGGATQGTTRLRQAAAAPESSCTALRLSAQIGRGGMGQVLAAEQPYLGREVAVKAVLAGGAGTQHLQALAHEVRTTAALEHPGVVPVHDAGIDFMVTKRVHGRTLAELLKAGGTPLADLVDAIVRLCDCAAFAHHRHVIHRDIKPGNVLVGSFGEVYLIDWGLALRCNPGGSGPDHVAGASAVQGGTPLYLAPETARGERALIGPAADVYALGAILYEAVAGQRARPGRTLAEVLAAAGEGVVASPPAAAAQAHGTLLALAMRALAPAPAARPSAAQLARDLRTWLAHAQGHAQALRHLAEAQRALAEARARPAPAECYPLLDACEHACTAALALDPALEAAADLAHAARRLHAERALAAGDLELAGSVLDEDDDPVLDDQRALLERERERRTHAAAVLLRTLRMFRVALGLAAAAAVALALIVATDQGRRRRARAAEAEAAMARLALAPDAGQAAREVALGAMQRALGLHPWPERLHGAVRAALLDYARWSERNQRVELAISLVERARSYGLGAAEAEPELARLRKLLEGRSGHEQRVERLAVLRAEAGGVADPGAWLASASAEILSWPWDAPAAAAQCAGLVRGLLERPEPLVRRLGLAVLAGARRPQQAAAGRALDARLARPLLLDADPAVAVDAATTLIAGDVRDAVLAIAEALIRADAAPLRRAALTQRSAWLQQHLQGLAGQTGSLRDAALRNAALGRIARACQGLGLGALMAQTLAAQGDAEAAFRRDVAAAYQRGDLAALARLAERGGDHPWGLVADIANARSLLTARRHADARRILEPRAEDPTRAALLPFLAEACLALGDHAAGERHADSARAAIDDGAFDSPVAMAAAMRIFSRLGWHADAVRMGRLLIERLPDDIAARAQLCWALMRAGRNDECLDVSTAGTERWPGTPELDRYRADALIGLNRAAEAERVASAALGRGKSVNEGLLLSWAQALRVQGRSAAASARLQTHLPRCAEVAFASATCTVAREADDLDSALRAADRMAALGAAGQASMTRIELHLERGLLNPALAEIEGLREIDGESLRRIFNTVCFAISGLRERGWPTLSPGELSEFAEAQAIAALMRRGDAAERIGPLLELMRRSADEAGDLLHADLIDAWLAGQDGDVRRLLDEADADDDEPERHALGAAMRAAIARGDRVLRPWRDWTGRRPIAALDADPLQRQRLARWYLDARRRFDRPESWPQTAEFLDQRP